MDSDIKLLSTDAELFCIYLLIRNEIIWYSYSQNFGYIVTTTIKCLQIVSLLLIECAILFITSGILTP